MLIMKKNLTMAIMALFLLPLFTACTTISTHAPLGETFSNAMTNPESKNIKSFKKVEDEKPGQCDLEAFVADNTNGTYTNLVDVVMTEKKMGFAAFVFSTSCNYRGIAVAYNMSAEKGSSSSSSGKKKSSKKKKKAEVEEEDEEEEEEEE